MVKFYEVRRELTCIRVNNKSNASEVKSMLDEITGILNECCETLSDASFPNQIPMPPAAYQRLAGMNDDLQSLVSRFMFDMNNYIQKYQLSCHTQDPKFSSTEMLRRKANERPTR